ncbi:MAG: hypothetical protein EZS28_024199 [Streblomastix strix]|uniref:HTH La-type RNA-binding domain-containing protein n=1 Tax=Streblomastix strix TaxID=222440 RepID=A0A5J4VCN1_9EUKA|nr:MAG: hypothetical protein EZS28_024199 [Streblomastix strix]
MQRKQIADIQDQVVENLPFDKFLQNEISKDADGWVPILTLLKFPKLASFTMDPQTVALALTYSKTLMLSEDRQSVRLKRDMHITQNVDQRRIYVQDFPISTSKEEIKVFFEQFGKIKSILLLKDLYSRWLCKGDL